MNGTHHPSWGILLPVCAMEPTKRAPWRVWGISSHHACNCLKICSYVVVSFVIQKNHKTKAILCLILWPPYFTRLRIVGLVMESPTKWEGNRDKAKALVHSVYLLTLFLRNVYKVLSNLRSRSLTPPLSFSPLPSSSPYLSSASLSFFKSVFSLLPAPQTRAAI